MHTSSVTCVDWQTITWIDWSVSPFADELAVFRMALSEGTEPIPYLRKVLSPNEIERAARYRRPYDQLRFSHARGLLRLLLARYTHQPPDRVEFVVGVNRKPQLKGSVNWHFNVSHSGNWILIAIGKVPVGVDLEWVNPTFSFRDIVQQSFSPDEQQYINACPDARSCFYRLWTRKEALVKATAKGMDEAFDRIPSLTGIHPAGAQLIGQDGYWTVNSFTLADGYPAALAYNGDSSTVPQFYTLDSELLFSLV